MQALREPQGQLLQSPRQLAHRARRSDPRQGTRARILTLFPRHTWLTLRKPRCGRCVLSNHPSQDLGDLLDYDFPGAS